MIRTKMKSGSAMQTEVPTGSVNGSNTVFTVSNTPVFVIIDGVVRVEGFGYSYDGGTITVNALVPPQEFIRSYYNE